MVDQAELMSIFSNLISEKKPMRLYNTYRSLPLSYDAKIVALKQETMVARVHPHQAVSMTLEGRTHIQSSTFPEVIRAKVVEVDIRKKQAVLNEFIGVGDEVGKRSSIRVQPDELLEADIYDGRRHVRGRIVDISANGICVFTYAHDMYGLSFRSGWEVEVDFTPPGTDTIMRFFGVITNINYHNGLYLHRIGLKIYPSPEVKPLIEEYVDRQQIAILDEIELKYQLMSQDNSRQ